MCVSHLYQYASPKCRDRSICKRTPLAQIHNRCETWTCLCPYLHWFGIVTAEGELPGRGGGNGAKAYHNRREEDAASEIRGTAHHPCRTATSGVLTKSGKHSGIPFVLMAATRLGANRNGGQAACAWCTALSVSSRELGLSDPTARNLSDERGSTTSLTLQ